MSMGNLMGMDMTFTPVRYLICTRCGRTLDMKDPANYNEMEFWGEYLDTASLPRGWHCPKCQKERHAERMARPE